MTCSKYGAPQRMGRAFRNPQPAVYDDMAAQVWKETEAARAFADAGDYASCARALRELWREVSAHMERDREI